MHNLHVIQYPSGRFGFVGSVPAILAVEASDNGLIEVGARCGIGMAQKIAERQGGLYPHPLMGDARRGDGRCGGGWLQHRGGRAMSVPKMPPSRDSGRPANQGLRQIQAANDETPKGEIETVARPLPPRRRRNADVRAREHLTPDEVASLLKAARKRGRYGQRDAAMILIGYRHGLRVSELVGLRWRDVDVDHGRLFVRRLKGSDDGAHPLAGDEIRALRQVRREWGEGSGHVFANERGAPMTAAGFRKMLARTGAEAGLLMVHPHMLRHGCGYGLIDRGVDIRTVQAWLGHRDISNTVRYTTVSARRFEGIWE